MILLLSTNSIFCHYSEPATYTFRFIPESNRNYEINNFFIRELARHNLTSLRNTSFSYHYNSTRRVDKVEPYTFSVSIEFAGMNCTGDIMYRGFDISDILTPDFADITAIIAKDGNYVYREIYSGIRAVDGVFNAGFTFESLSDIESFDLKLEDTRFYSDFSDKEKFSQRVNLIDSYYASIEAMDIMITELAGLKYRQGDLIRNYIKIKEFQRIFSEISDAGFRNMLHLDKEDVAGFFNKLRQFQIQIETANDRLQRSLNAFNLINPGITLKMIADIYVDEISRFFIRSQTVSHTLQTFYYGLGFIDFDAAYLSTMLTAYPDILKKTKYSNHHSQIVDRLREDTYNSFVSQAQFFIEKEQYNIARGLLINAKKFYFAANGSQHPVELNILISKADFGIYNSYIHIIDRAIDIGNYDMADTYLERATLFQRDNSSTIISNKHIIKVSEDLIELYINKGFSLAASDEFKEAVYCFEQANQLSHRIKRFNKDYMIKRGLITAVNGYYNFLLSKMGEHIESGNLYAAANQMSLVNDLEARYTNVLIESQNKESVQRNLDYFVYNQEVLKGLKYLNSANYNMAYEHLLRALELEMKSGFRVYKSVHEEFSRAASAYLINLCNQAEIKVLKDQLDEAREIYAHCVKLQRDYGLIYEPVLQASLALLNNNIFSKNCELAGFRFEGIISNFSRVIDSGDFLHAMEVLDEAVSLMQVNYYCEFDRSHLALLEARYRPAAQYQILAEEANRALQGNDKQRFTEIYKEMESLSQSNEIIRKRIEPLPLHYLFSVKKNLAFLENLINDYQSTAEFETGIKILHTLAANSQSGREVKSIQQNLAYKLAEADKRSIDRPDPQQKVEKYTEGNAWFRHFRKAYLNSW